MLKKKVKIEEEIVVEEPKSRGVQIRRLRKSSKDDSKEHKVAESSNSLEPLKVLSSGENRDIESWIEERLLKNLIEKIRDYEYLKVYSQTEWGEPLSNREFISNLLKAFFAKDDLASFQRNLEHLIAMEMDSERLKSENLELKGELESLKSTNRELLNSRVSKNLLLDEALGSFKGEIRELLEEEATTGDNEEFFVAFVLNLRDILETLEKTENLEESIRLESIYSVTLKLFKAISNRYVVNRKRLLSQLAKYLSNQFEKYRFISPEDYTFVDGKIHNIVEKRGQKIKEGLSFGVVKSETSQVVKYADVVTF